VATAEEVVVTDALAVRRINYLIFFDDQRLVFLGNGYMNKWGSFFILILILKYEISNHLFFNSE
jgi:hypothetical protein